jgi:hypothetical protein
MKTIQNIHQDLTTIFSRAIQLVSGSLCGDFNWDVVLGFSYNNEPKQDFDGV